MRRRKYSLHISEFKMKNDDRLIIINKYKHIDELKSKIKLIPKTETDLFNILKKEIHSIRKELIDNYAHRLYTITITLGPHQESETISYYPTIDNVTYVKEKLLERLSKDRKAKKKLHVNVKEVNGITYEMVGAKAYKNEYVRPLQYTYGVDRVAGDTGGLRGVIFPAIKPEKVLMPGLQGNGNVFMESGSILKFLNGPGYNNRILRPKKPYDKSNHVGIEIELICKLSREKLQKEFVDARLAGNVYLKDDTSIQREKEGEWTHEITIIGKQQYINDIVSRVCVVLNNETVGAYVNDSCGIHVHVDMRNRAYRLCFGNFVDALPILIAMVPASRTQSKYCTPNLSSDCDYRIGNGYDRRQAINPLSFESHKTIEIRLHSGSTNAVKINNWVNILTAIADKKELNNGINCPDDMRREFGLDSKLIEYINKRINKFKNNKNINTKDDHFDQAV